MIDPSRVLIGCATKEGNKDNANLETEYLFKTINHFGGSLATSKKLACFLEKPNDEISNLLNDLEVITKITKPLEPRDPYSAKIRIIEEAMKEDIDYIVMLDTDIVACHDFSKYIEGNKIKAANYFVGEILPDVNKWKELFEFFGIAFPKEKFKSGSDINKIVHYCNTGVIIIPVQYAKLFFETWKKFEHKLCDNKDKFFMKIPINDQITLPLTFAETQIPFEPLPVIMNFDIPLVDESNGLYSNFDPILIHYLHRISDNGDIFHCTYEKANKNIDMVNAYLKKNRKIKFNNETAVCTHYILQILFHEKDFRQIIRRLSKLPKDSKDVISQFSLARALQKTGKDPNEALYRYDISIKNGFHNPFIIHYNSGALYSKLGKFKDAKKEFENALKIKPEHPGVVKQLEKILNQNDN